jgi:hypothetical protein
MTLRRAAMRLPWGGSAVWESHIARGTDVVCGSSQTSATHIVWGTSHVGEVEGDHIVWGTATDPASTVWANLAEAPPGDQ